MQNISTPLRDLSEENPCGEVQERTGSAHSAVSKRVSDDQPNLATVSVRPAIRGKFIFVGEKKLYIRGVTYGPFRPDEHGNEHCNPDVVERDFARMRANAVNAVRTYSVPPRWFLDAASLHGLRVMVGLPWEQHVAFLDEKERTREIEKRVRIGVRACAGHPAVLCYAIGNEIPSSIVRWHGAARVERYLKRLYLAAKEEDPGGLVTYANYPSTEYLQLPFVDFCCFNIYLESQGSLRDYLARLQNLAGDRPLVIGEVGLDSHRQGEEAQAEMVRWQVRTVFETGCGGLFVFSWTDEWHRGGCDIENWGFGLTHRDRRPKPALDGVRQAFTEGPFPLNVSWPRISVVICVYNGERIVRECFDGLLKLDYPDHEVIVVDDGSTDATSAIAKEYGFKVIRTEQLGLSNARNVGMEAATGEIVAYTDSDASPDPHWLTYLASTFLTTPYVAVGGPNIPPPDDGMVAECVSSSPGGPVHVLLSDQEAEHIPGCNMAFRKSALRAIGGFDTQFHVAGDDVDVCWRVREKGWTIGFNPAAVVWHHRRNSIRGFWRQQLNYGKSEALLERKWPEKYNVIGHLTWAGRIYGNSHNRPLPFRRWRIYHGVWGSGLFQSIYEPARDGISSLVLMPEWYLVVAALGALTALGSLWPPLLLTLPLLALSLGALFVQAAVSAAHADHVTPMSKPPSRLNRMKSFGLTVFLHLMQPLSRLCGRLRLGLKPWRSRIPSGLVLPRPRTLSQWSEDWQAPAARLESLERELRDQRAVVLRGGDYDSWDLMVRGGMLGAVQIRMAVEEHGKGRQLIRFRARPAILPAGRTMILFFTLLLIGAVISQGFAAAAIIGAVEVLLGLRVFQECGAAMAAALFALPSKVKQQE